MNEKQEFVFGGAVVDDRYDLSNESELLLALEEAFPDGVSDLSGESELGSNTLRAVIANQIFGGEVPEVWEAVERYRAEERSDAEALNHLLLVLADHLERSLSGEASSHDGYVAMLQALPLSTLDVVFDGLREAVEAQPGLSQEALIASQQVAGPLQAIEERRVRNCVDTYALDEIGAVTVRPDRVFPLRALLDGMVLTRRVTAEEIAADALLFEEDLEPFAYAASFWAGDQPKFVSIGSAGAIGLAPGALKGLSPGQLVKCTANADKFLSVEAQVEEPQPSQPLVETLNATARELLAAYDSVVSLGEVVLEAAANGVSFDQVQPPLSVLFDMTGLERRGNHVADTEAQWYWHMIDGRDDRVARFFSVDVEDADHVLELLHDATIIIDNRISGDAHPEDLATARFHVQDCLADPVLIDGFAIEFFVHEPEARRQHFVDDLADATSRVGRGIAKHIAALHAESLGDVAAAEQYLELARSADDKNEAVAHRLGWYASDRGNGRRALSLLGVGGTPNLNSRTIATIRSCMPVAESTPGRNEPCWCGSGRKFKRCHSGNDEPAPIEVRSSWLLRKLAMFIDHGLHESRDELIGLVLAVAGSMDPDQIQSTLNDPLILDLLTKEAGWMQRFADERSSLLPEDEALTLASWLLADRSVCEITDVRRGEGLSVRDMRTGDIIDVAEVSFTESVSVGESYCLLIVPVGSQHQIIGGIFPVPVGLEADVLALLDIGDPLAIAAWVGASRQPPTIVDRHGNAIDLGDPAFDPEQLFTGTEIDGDRVDSMSEIRAAMEERWCDENVPAIGGVTPRDAAADPTRRDDLIRLIASFERLQPSTESDAMTFRPWRLRELLGLED